MESEVLLLTQFFQNKGADDAQALRMASQLMKRARQLAETKAISKKEALELLLKKIIEAQ